MWDWRYENVTMFYATNITHFLRNFTTYLHSVMIDTSETAIHQTCSMLYIVIFFFSLIWSVTQNTVSGE
jgi:hypothetical protein